MIFKKIRAFTLLEILISLGIASLLIEGILVVVQEQQRNAYEIRAYQDITQTGIGLSYWFLAFMKRCEQQGWLVLSKENLPPSTNLSCQLRVYPEELSLSDKWPESLVKRSKGQLFAIFIPQSEPTYFYLTASQKKPFLKTLYLNQNSETHAIFSGIFDFDYHDRLLTFLLGDKTIVRARPYRFYFKGNWQWANSGWIYQAWPLYLPDLAA